MNKLSSTARCLRVVFLYIGQKLLSYTERTSVKSKFRIWWIDRINSAVFISCLGIRKATDCPRMLNIAFYITCQLWEIMQDNLNGYEEVSYLGTQIRCFLVTLTERESDQNVGHCSSRVYHVGEHPWFVEEAETQIQFHWKICLLNRALA